MDRPISLVAKGAAVLVTLVGLYASAQAANAFGTLEQSLSGGFQRSPHVGAFLVSFLFFGSLATLLWIAGETRDAVEELRRQEQHTQSMLRSLRGERLDPVFDTVHTLARSAPPAMAAAPSASAAPASPAPLPTPRSPASSPAAPAAAPAVEECRIERAGSSARPEYRAVQITGGGWILVDYERFFEDDAGAGPVVDRSAAGERALHALTDRLVAAGWRPLAQDDPEAVPRFSRIAPQPRSTPAASPVDTMPLLPG